MSLSSAHWALLYLLITLPLLIFTSQSNYVTFIILGQRSHFDNLKAATLKDSILQQSESLRKDVKVIIPHIDFPHIIGFWAPWTLISRISSAVSSEWFIFVESDSVVDAAVVFELLKSFDPQSKVFLGHGLYDESPTIIHHFYGFDNNDDSKLLYPDFAAGFILSRGLFTCLAVAVDSSATESGSSFAIDAKHEFALLVQKLCKTSLSSYPDQFCLRKEEGCAIFYEENLCSSESLLTPQDIYVGVKTFSGYHNSRLPVIKRTWSAHLPFIEYFSDLVNNVVPTIDAGVPNTEKGHCAKTFVMLKRFVNYMDTGANSRNFSWMLIADDDTLISIPRLLRFLSCYDSNEKIIIGERYGYGFSASGVTGYDYPTGGSGIVFSRAAARVIVSNCECPANDSPDDMIIGMCSRRNDVNIIHSAAFHQARPIDYPEPYIRRLSPISFHKFEEIDPYEVFMEYLYEPHITRKRTEL